MSIIQNYQNEILTASAIIIVLLSGAVISLFVKLKKNTERLNRFSDAAEGLDIEKILGRMQRDITDLQTGNILRESRINDLQNALSFTIGKVGFVRYNAFVNSNQNRGGELSFSIAFLDGYNNGFVLSSIYASSQSISYAKPIKNKKSDIPLSDEEVLAIEKAIRGDNISNGV